MKPIPALLGIFLLVSSAFSAPLFAQRDATRLSAQALAQDSAYTSTIDKIVNIINQLDVAAFIDIMDITEFAAKVAKYNADDEKSRQMFVNAYSTRKSEFVTSIFRNLKFSNAQAKFMKIVSVDGNVRALVRLSMGDTGYDYWELELQRAKDGSYKLVDWYQLSTGQLLSTTLGAITNLLAKPSPGLLESLFGIKKVDPNLLHTMNRISGALKQRDLPTAVSEFEKLPDKIKFSRVMCSVGINIANLSQDEQLYEKMLARLDKYHSKDPSAAFALLDYHILQKHYDKAINSVDAIEQRVGRDAFVLLLYANINLLKKDYSQAVKFSKQSIENEKDFIDAYDTLSLSYVKLGQFADAVKIYKTLSSDFGFSFDKENFTQDEDFAQFVKSKEFKAWLN